jgi:hypothetical protein
MLQAGNYKATRIKECFIAESKEKKTPYFGIVFELENKEEATWTVYLAENFQSDKQREMAEKNMETLAMLGYKGSRLADMADDALEISDLFDDFYDDVSITIEMEQYEKDGVTKETPKVKWVNVGSKGGHIKLDKKQAVVKTKSLIYDGAFLKAKKALPERAEKKKGNDFTESDIPF